MAQQFLAGPTFLKHITQTTTQHNRWTADGQTQKGLKRMSNLENSKNEFHNRNSHPHISLGVNFIILAQIY